MTITASDIETYGTEISEDGETYTVIECGVCRHECLPEEIVSVDPFPVCEDCVGGSRHQDEQREYFALMEW